MSAATTSLSSLRVGAVFFDGANNITGRDRTITSLETGWASISGGTARRISSVHDLPSDVIWYTNLDYAQFIRVGLGRHANFRNAEWLRTNFHGLIAELGIGQENLPPHEMISMLAQVAQRVTKNAQERYGVALSHPKLNHDFSEALQVPRSAFANEFYPVLPPIAQHPAVKVVHTNNYHQASPTVTVRCNRLQHARAVLSTPVPSDMGWEMENPSSLKKRSADWLDSLETPFLVKVSVANVQPMVSDVLSWSSGSKAPREWLTDTEWRLFRGFADITIKAALICRLPATRLEVYDQLPTEHMAELSLTYGLIAEQMWTAFTNPMPYRINETRWSVAAAWLRAADRLRMFDFAQKLHARGLTVSSYGVGSVVLRYPASGGLQRTLAMASETGLLPPASRIDALARGAA
jgi:hypothetical protein